MAELPKHHQTCFTGRCHEYLQLFRNSPLLAQGTFVSSETGWHSLNRHHRAEFRMNTVVVFRMKEHVLQSQVGPEDIMTVFEVADYAVHLEQSDKEARVCFRGKHHGNKSVMFIQTTIQELKNWKQGLEHALTRRTPSLSDIRVLRCIGKGGFGKVFLVKLVPDALCRRKSQRSIFDCAMDPEGVTDGIRLLKGVEHGPYFALKVLPKVNAFKSRTSLHHVITERNLLESLNGPYFLSLSFAFQTRKNFYLGTPLCAGGDLSSYLKRKGVTEFEFPNVVGGCDSVVVVQGLPEKTVRAIAAQILVGLSYLHSKRVMYRDLKPENLFIETNGNLRFGDWGLAKVIPNSNEEEGKEAIEASQRRRMPLKRRTNTKCGTKYYRAPEVEYGEYSFAADIWSFGVLLYNLLTGKLPFSPCDNHRQSNKREGCPRVSTLFFPESLSKSAKGLISKLLQVQAERRPTFSQIRRHRFFRHIHWKAVEEVVAPAAIPDVMNGCLDITDPKACCEFALRTAELLPCSNELLDDEEDWSDSISVGGVREKWGLIGFDYGLEARAEESLKICFRKGGFQWSGASSGWPWMRLPEQGVHEGMDVV